MYSCPTGYVYPGMHQQDPATFPSPYGARTKYHYFTPDGLPPNAGEVPSAPKPPYDGMPLGPVGFGGGPFGCQFGASPFGPAPFMPPSYGFGGFPFGGLHFGGPPIGSPAVPPGPPKPSHKDKKVTVSADPPVPSPSSNNQNACHQGQRTCHHSQPVCSHHSVPACGETRRAATNLDGTCEKEEPVSNARANGMLATFDDGAITHLPSKVNPMFHVFKDNIITKSGKHRDCKDPIIISNIKSLPFFSQSVSANSTIAELIEQIDCKKRANTHPPWNRPGNGYPEHCIGIQEMLEEAEGRFIPGSKIMLTDNKARCTIRDIWPDLGTTSGRSAPRWLIRWPC